MAGVAHLHVQDERGGGFEVQGGRVRHGDHPADQIQGKHAAARTAGHLVAERVGVVRVIGPDPSDRCTDGAVFRNQQYLVVGCRRLVGVCHVDGHGGRVEQAAAVAHLHVQRIARGGLEVECCRSGQCQLATGHVELEQAHTVATGDGEDQRVAEVRIAGGHFADDGPASRVFGDRKGLIPDSRSLVHRRQVDRRGGRSGQCQLATVGHLDLQCEAGLRLVIQRVGVGHRDHPAERVQGKGAAFVTAGDGKLQRVAGIRVASLQGADNGSNHAVLGNRCGQMVEHRKFVDVAQGDRDGGRIGQVAAVGHPHHQRVACGGLEVKYCRSVHRNPAADRVDLEQAHTVATDDGIDQRVASVRVAGGDLADEVAAAAVFRNRER